MSSVDKKSVLQKLRGSSLLSEYEQELHRLFESSDSSSYEHQQQVGEYATLYQRKQILLNDPSGTKHLPSEDTSRKNHLKDTIYAFLPQYKVAA